VCARNVQDADLVGAEVLGQALLPASALLQESGFDGWLPLTDAAGKPVGITSHSSGLFQQASVRLTLTFTPVTTQTQQQQRQQQQQQQAQGWMRTLGKSFKKHARQMLSNALSTPGLASPAPSGPRTDSAPQVLQQQQQQHHIPHSYFPLRHDNRVTLYHDAACTPGPVPGVVLQDGQQYVEHSCWHDLYTAIMAAER
jgi:hypothetical protein